MKELIADCISLVDHGCNWNTSVDLTRFHFASKAVNFFKKREDLTSEKVNDMIGIYNRF